jgi:predicted RNA-binding Zn-ribbon protein involved in translation (DUF1610 family)
MVESPIMFRKDEVQKLLRAIMDGKIKSIEPDFNYESGVRYSIAEEIMGIHGKALELTLKELTEIDVLIPEVRGNVEVCPICGSHQSTVTLSCPTCGSPNLSKGVMIEHFGCGFLDLEEAFRRGEELVCPRCGKILRAIGIDYRKLGMLYKCDECQQRFPSPKRRYTCRNGHNFGQDEQVLDKIYAYRPNPEKYTLIEKETLDFKPLLERLTKNGWFGQSPATFQGRSGVELEFAFALWAPKTNSVKQKPFVLADVYTSVDAVDSNVVLVFIAKTIDVEAFEKILMVMPRLNEKARTLVKSYNISVIESETTSELTEKLRSLLPSMVQKWKDEKLQMEVLEVDHEELKQG